MSKLALLEAALFITEKPLSIEKLKNILNVDEEELKRLLRELEKRYESVDSGIEISKIGGLRLTTKPKYIEDVKKLTRHADLSRGLLRVLSIVAHNKKIKQSDLVKILGNRVYEYVRELSELGFIKTEKCSRTKIITTTRQFDEYFGLKQ